ncbi:hypothetical protein ACOT81_38545 [Streptomyces sp. WI04-05B]|nr:MULTISPECIES: hypothetical protein [Streptomyces]MDX2547499.1 hypothetical protein [Streptomyces sp. WI04-05B]MDX2589892.1 hypothetical protein [Streptomyces sp. WI04-05A]
MRMDWPDVPDWMADCAECCRMYRGVVAAYELPPECPGTGGGIRP